MGKIKLIIRKSLIGGVLVLLPIVIIGFVFRWLFNFITDLIQPLTDYTVRYFPVPEVVADLSVVLLILALCFVIGTFVTTTVGKWLHDRFDRYLIKLAPGYRIVKEIVSQVFGSDENSPFAKGEVVKVKIFGASCETTVTALVTSRHTDGTVTIFMPTGPNPTSGNIYHMPESLVEFYPDVSVEQMMRTIIACGAGSDKLFASAQPVNQTTTKPQ
ncbi:DUF502 domain-containing protein [Aliikangiella sp. IMCC44632]